MWTNLLRKLGNAHNPLPTVDQVIACDSEALMLEKFRDFFLEADPDIVIHHNGKRTKSLT